jgi:hypothetical protein
MISLILVERIRHVSFMLWQSPGLRQWKTGFILRLFFLATVMVLTSCDGSHGNYQVNERNTMEAAKSSSVRNVPQPPVDLKVPEMVETATFALG